MELNTRMQKRVAFQPSGLMTREAEDKKPMIEGVAIVTNAETVLWEGPEWREIEVIDPACIAKEIIDESDIKLNLLHERSLSFARWNKGKGSLKLETREDGLHFACPGDESQIAKQASDLISNGTYTGCSFEFYPQDYEVSERKGADGKQEYVIRHTKMAAITAITVGMDPAYQQTSVNARELYMEMHREEEEDGHGACARPNEEGEEETEKKEAEDAAGKETTTVAEEKEEGNEAGDPEEKAVEEECKQKKENAQKYTQESTWGVLCEEIEAELAILDRCE